MNKAAIKAELRRSACEDANPYQGVSSMAFRCMEQYEDYFGQIEKFLPHDLRIVFLFVAEAL